MVLSVEYCKTPEGCGEWVARTANLWRTTSDVQSTWESVMGNIHEQDKMALVAKPGHFNDPVHIPTIIPGTSNSYHHSLAPPPVPAPPP